MNVPTASLFRSDYKNIDFSTNWNNKLNCKCFTTFRLWKNQFRVGQLAIVRLNDTEIKLVKIEVVTPIRLYEVTESLALTDAGLTLDKFKALIHRMYKGKVLSVDDVSYVLITLVTVETYTTAPSKS